MSLRDVQTSRAIPFLSPTPALPQSVVCGDKEDEVSAFTVVVVSEGNWGYGPGVTFTLKETHSDLTE